MVIDGPIAPCLAGCREALGVGEGGRGKEGGWGAGGAEICTRRYAPASFCKNRKYTLAIDDCHSISRTVSMWVEIDSLTDSVTFSLVIKTRVCVCVSELKHWNAEKGRRRVSSEHLYFLSPDTPWGYLVG